jgi:RimJ/RimL family protein N-acetyltransferase
MEPVRLRSGREVAIRPIRPDDAPELQAAYERLSPESKYRRFMSGKPRLSTAEARYLTQLDGSDHHALVATPARGPQSILAVGRYIRLLEHPEAAEFAIVVGDPYQREGLAAELLERLAQAAREHGIKRFTATMLADNVAAHRLVRRLAAGGMVPHGDGAKVAVERHLGALDEIDVELAA